MSNKRTTRDLISPNFKLYCKAMVIKQQGIDIEHSPVDCTEDLDIDSHTYRYMILDKTKILYCTLKKMYCLQ